MEATTGDRVRFRQLFEAHYESISRYCHRRLPSADANDAAAEVFAVAWRKLDQVPSDNAALPWLYGIARNEVSTMRRSVRRLGFLRAKLASEPLYGEPGPESVVVRNAEQRQLLAALGTLRPWDQEIIRLRAYEELSFPEVAVVLDFSVDAAKKRSARAMRRLRRAVGLPEPQRAVLGSRATQEGGDG